MGAVHGLGRALQQKQRTLRIQNKEDQMTYVDVVNSSESSKRQGQYAKYFDVSLFDPSLSLSIEKSDA